LAGELYRNTPLFLTRERLSNQSEMLEREIAFVGRCAAKCIYFRQRLP
jgi:hypothetical protein